jgi:hypothetical protein
MSIAHAVSQNAGWHFRPSRCLLLPFIVYPRRS